MQLVDERKGERSNEGRRLSSRGSLLAGGPLVYSETTYWLP